MSFTAHNFNYEKFKLKSYFYPQTFVHLIRGLMGAQLEMEPYTVCISNLFPF